MTAIPLFTKLGLITVRHFINRWRCFLEFPIHNNPYTFQTSLAKLLKEMKDSFKDIWTNELILEATNALIAAMDVPEGTNVVIQGIASLGKTYHHQPVVIHCET